MTTGEAMDRALSWAADCMGEDLSATSLFLKALVVVLADGTNLTHEDLARMVNDPGWGP